MQDHPHVEQQVVLQVFLRYHQEVVDMVELIQVVQEAELVVVALVEAVMFLRQLPLKDFQEADRQEVHKEVVAEALVQQEVLLQVPHKVEMVARDLHLVLDVLQSQEVVAVEAQKVEVARQAAVQVQVVPEPVRLELLILEAVEEQLMGAVDK